MVELTVLAATPISIIVFANRFITYLYSLYFVSIFNYSDGNRISVFLFFCFQEEKSDVCWLLCCGICRYAYSEETGDEFDEEGISLTSSAMHVGGDTVAKREFPDGLGEALEEDKRE